MNKIINFEPATKSARLINTPYTRRIDYVLHDICEAMAISNRERKTIAERGISRPGTRQATTDLQRLRSLWRARLNLQEFAALKFAKLNGWKISKDFSPEDIGKVSRRPCRCLGVDVPDHPLFFLDREKRCAAIVGQPYTDYYYETFALRYDLALHVPNYPKASIHYPDGCFFVVFTAPGRSIQWLPEQVAGLAVQS
jgi:hypothetical protein